MKDGSFRNVRFFVAGDSAFAGLVAVDLARQGVNTKLITAPDSMAVGIAAANALPTESIGYAAFLPLGSLSEASHLVLFPADLCEMVLWLSNTADFFDPKGRRGPLQVFVGAPTIDSFSAVRRGALSAELSPQLAVRFFLPEQDIARDFLYEHFTQRSRSLVMADGFLLVGSDPIAESLALKIARLGGQLDGAKSSLDWVVPGDYATHIRATYPELKEACILTLHASDSGVRAALESLALPTKVLILAEGAKGLELLLGAGDRKILSRFAGTYVADFQSKRLNNIFRKRFEWGADLGSIRFFGDLSCIASIERFQEEGRFGLPRSIHERYCHSRLAAGELAVDNPSLRSWDQIGEDLRQANQEQADHILYKLSLLGYGLENDPQAKGPPIVFSNDEFESLAKLEHLRWSADRRLAGWTYGKIRDNELRRHPMLVPYDELPESEKEKDRQTVRDVPSVLRGAGLIPRRL
jgi:RyR domain